MKWRDETNYPSDSAADSDLASEAGSAASSNHRSYSASESEVNAASESESEALEAERKHLARGKRALSAEPYESETTKTAKQQQTDETAEERPQQSQEKQPQSQQPQQPQEQQQPQENRASLNPAASENEQKLDRNIRKVEELKAHLAAFSGAKSIALAKSQRVTANNIIAGIEMRLNLNSMAAISAGDDDETAVGDEEKDAKAVKVNAGLYINPFTSKATAKESKNSSGYGASSSGFTVGFDSQVNDLLLLGMSYTKEDSHINFKSSHLGDKALIDSNFYSLYGQLAPLHQKYFLSAIAIYGKSDISSKARRGSSDTELGRHKAYSNILEVLAGRSQRFLQSFSVTPQLGLKYSKTKDAAYTERVAVGTPSLIVGRAKSKDFDAIAGLKIDYRYNLSRDITLIPEVYGFASKAINSKAALIRTKIQLDADTIVLPDIRATRSKLDLSYGSSVSIRAKYIDISAGYHAVKARKLMSYAGSLKVKINL